jgi:HSP20 family protein
MKMIVRNPWTTMNDLAAFGRAFDRAYAQTGAPALDVIETDDAFVVKAALPGWTPEQVEITLDKHVLTLKGEAQEEAEGGKLHWKEISRAAFSRSLRLPQGIDADAVTAKFEHGVLTVTVPKAEVAKPRAIKIG